MGGKKHSEKTKVKFNRLPQFTRHQNELLSTRITKLKVQHLLTSAEFPMPSIKCVANESELQVSLINVQTNRMQTKIFHSIASQMPKCHAKPWLQHSSSLAAANLRTHKKLSKINEYFKLSTLKACRVPWEMNE